MKSHYELLEISIDASANDIRHAWARLVRLFPPDQHPETNRLLNEAKTCLLDKRARAAYDERLVHGDELDRLLREATKCMDEANYDGAIETLAELVALGPTRSDARWMLAQCYEYKSDFENAERQYIRLTQVEPTNGLFAYGLADMYHAWGAVLTKKYSVADQWYQLAISLAPYNAQYHRGRAENFASQKKYDKAEACLFEAISADGRKDVNDIETTLRLLHLYAETGKVSRFVDVVSIIKECVEGDKSAATQASYKILDFVANYVKATNDWETSGKLVLAMRTVCTHFGEKETYAALVELKGKAAKQLKTLNNSNVQPVIVINLINLFALPEFGGGYVDATTVKKLRQEVENWPHADVIQGWNTAKKRYPQLCSLVQASVLPIIESSQKEPAPIFVDDSPIVGNGGQDQVTTESNPWPTIIKFVVGLIVFFLIRNIACS